MPKLNYNIGGIIVDDVVCLNIKRRHDRRTKFKRMSKKKNVPFRFYKGVDDKNNPEAARWQAHIDVWKQFKTYKGKLKS